MTPDMDECDALAQLRKGDVRGLELLVRTYQLDAVRMAYSIAQDLSLAEEITQEAFIRVFERIQQYDDSRPFKAWFLKIVVNDTLKALRARQRLVPLVEPECEDSDARIVTADGPCAIEQDEFGDGSDDRRLFGEVLDHLTPCHRAVLQLKYYLDMSDDEIARALQVPVGTVKSRLHAAKFAFRCFLAHMQCLVHED